MSSLKDEVSDLRAESLSLTSRTAALEKKPEAEAFDPSEIQEALEQLSRDIDRLDGRVRRAATTQDVIDMGEALSADQEADFDHFDECIDDLLTISNGASPPDGLVC